MVLLQGNEAVFDWARLIVEPVEDPGPVFQGAWSLNDGAVPGLTGEKGPPPWEGLRVGP